MQISNNGWDVEFSGRSVGEIYPDLARFLENFLCQLPSGSKIIDIGCGDGKYSFLMADKGFDVLGTDSSVVAIEVASEHLRTYSRPSLRFRRERMQDQTGMEGEFESATLSPGPESASATGVYTRLRGFRASGGFFSPSPEPHGLHHGIEGWRLPGKVVAMRCTKCGSVSDRSRFVPRLRFRCLQCDYFENRRR